MNKQSHGRRGQSLTEYMLLLCLLTVASIPIVTILSNVLRDRLETAAQRIGGKAANSKADGYLAPASEKVRRDLKDFWKQ